MKRTDIGNLPVGTNLNDPFKRWATNAIEQLAASSKQTTDILWDEYTVSNITTTRTFDPTTVTLEELAHVVGTLIEDYQGRTF